MSGRWQFGWLWAAALGVVGVGVCVGGCSTTQAANDLGAPLSVIPKTDVVVETNIQAVVQAAQTVLQTTQSFASFGTGTAAGSGTNVTSGPSTSPGQISYAVAPGGQGVVLVGWNHADQHCLGQLYIAHTLTTSVLGESAPGQYDFVAPASSGCDAASYLAQPSAPSGWPETPSASGWPSG